MVKPGYVNMKRKGKFKKLSNEMRDCIAATIKAILHAHRDELRNKGVDAEKVPFDCRSGYYGEAFGIMRALEIQGFGYFGPTTWDGVKDRGTDQPEQNLRWWLWELEQEVLSEEHFDGDGRCEYCLGRWGKDDRSLRERRGMPG